jgi:hypothetical protein
MRSPPNTACPFCLSFPVAENLPHTGDGKLINSEWLNGHGCRSSQIRRHPKSWKSQKSGAGHHEIPPARLGRLAPALLGLPDPDGPLREMRNRARAGQGPARPELPDDINYDAPGNPL